MIDVKQAVAIAKQKASEILERGDGAVAELEREEYKGVDVWRITLGYDRLSTPKSISGLLGGPASDYRSFLINSENGELVAIKIREVATR